MPIYSFVPDYFIPANCLNGSPFNLTGNAAGGRAYMDGYVQKVRNLMRNGDGLGRDFNAALPAAFKVSDIARVASGVYDYYMFEVKNTALNMSWLFVFPGRDSSGDAMTRGDQVQPGGSGVGFNYAQSWSAAPGTGSIGVTNPVIFVFINSDVTTDDFDLAFNNTTNLTYTGGDFTAPSTSNLPWNTPAKMAAFLPSHLKDGRGLAIPLGGSTSLEALDLMINFNDESTDCGVEVLGSYGGDKDCSNISIQGKCVESVTPGDTFLSAHVWASFNTTGASYGVPASGEGYVDGRTSAGAAKTNWNLVPQKTLTLGNEKVGADFIWYRLGVVEGANNKGFVKASWMREIGGLNTAKNFRQRFAAPTGADCMVKFASTFALRYPPDVATFPFTFPERL